MHRLDDPVDAGIAADGLVLRINKDDLEVLVGRVLVNPVRVENAQVGAATADTLLSGATERTLVLELVHTMVGGLAYSTKTGQIQVLPVIETPIGVLILKKGIAYHKWHPWGHGACDHHGERGHGR